MANVPSAPDFRKPAPTPAPDTLSERVRALCQLAASERFVVHVWYPISAVLVPIGDHTDAPSWLLAQQLHALEDDVLRFAVTVVEYNQVTPAELLRGRCLRWDSDDPARLAIAQPSLERLARFAATHLRTSRGRRLRRHTADAIASALEALAERSRQPARRR